MAGKGESQEEAAAGAAAEGWLGLRHTLFAVVIGAGLFLGSWFFLDLQPLSDQERKDLFEFTVAVPMLLDLCADRAYGDPSSLRRASAQTAELFRTARDRSAAGLVPVPAGSTMAAELDRLSVDAVEHAREAFGPARSAADWRALCTGLQTEFRSEDTAWAWLQEKFPRQLRKLDLSRAR